MAADAYFEGANHDFFVKPVILGDVVGGEVIRWAGPEDGTPDAFTVYRMPTRRSMQAGESMAVEDHFDRDTATARAQQLALEDKTEALLCPDSGEFP